DDVEMVVGCAFRHQHVAFVQVAKRKTLRERASLLVRELDGEARGAQCVDERWVHDTSPFVGESRADGRPAEICSARRAYASTNVFAMPSNTRPASLPNSSARSS